MEAEPADIGPVTTLRLRRCRRIEARMIHLGSTEDARLLDSVYKAFAAAKRLLAYGKLDVNRPEPPG